MPGNLSQTPAVAKAASTNATAMIPKGARAPAKSATAEAAMVPMLSEMPAETAPRLIEVVTATECATRVTTSAIQVIRKSWRGLSAAMPATTNGATVQRPARTRRMD
ncbi:MAG: hypothetical protein ABIP93_12480 [Gemmatimonadaceae bacterium]